MHMLRLRLIIALLLVAAAPAQAAQIYPSKPVRFLVGPGPGSGTDIMARAIALKLTERLGQAVVVDNRPGAGGTVAIAVAAKAAPDGYTLLFVSGSLVIHPFIYAKLPYDPVRDLAPVTLIANLPFILVVNPAFAATNVAELLALAKSRPGQINYASIGNGSAVHLATELFKTQAGIHLVHIPYKGSAGALNSVVSGDTSLMFVNLLSSRELVKAGKLRALATASGKRLAAEPGLPTVAEAGVPGYAFQAWFGVVAPAGTPRPIIDRLNQELRRLITIPEVRDRLTTQGGFELAGGTPEAFSALIRSEIGHWGKLVKQTGARVD